MNVKAVFEELKSLPPRGLEMAADYIHRLHAGSRLERKAALRRTAPSLASEEAVDPGPTLDCHLPIFADTDKNLE